MADSTLRSFLWDGLQEFPHSEISFIHAVTNRLYRYLLLTVFGADHEDYVAGAGAANIRLP